MKHGLVEFLEREREAEGPQAGPQPIQPLGSPALRCRPSPGRSVGLRRIPSYG